MRADVFFDSNVLIYAVKRGDARSDRAEELLLAGGCISVQVLNEFASVCHRKLRLEWAEVGKRLREIRLLCHAPSPITLNIHERALELARRYKLSFYDCVIVASALDAGCKTLYSEDLQHGQIISGLRVVNPFL